MRAAGRRSLSLQGSRSTYTNGSFRGNPILGGMCRARRTSQQSSLSKIPELLVQPLLPGLSYSRRSTTLIRKQSCDLSSLRAQSTSGDRYQCKTTNVNFTGFQNHRLPHSRRDGQKTTRSGPSRLSTKHLISLHRQSKITYLLNAVQNTLEENPRVRPSVCSFITGLFVMIIGLVFFTVPLSYFYIPSWLSLVLICAGAVAMLAGIIGSSVYVYKKMNNAKKSSEKKTTFVESSSLKKHETKPCKHEIIHDHEKTEFDHLKTYDVKTKAWSRQHVANSSLPTCKSKESCCHGQPGDKATKIQKQQSNGLRFHPTNYLETQSLLFPTVVPSVCSEFQHKDKKHVNNIGIDTKASPPRPVANVTTTSISPMNFHALERDGYYSSEPNLIFDGNSSAKWQEANKENVRTKNEIPKDVNMAENMQATEQSAVNTHRQAFSEAVAVNYQEDNDHPVQVLPTLYEETMHSAQLTAAKEIFDVYHDPLLHRAVTWLTFKCHLEFRPNGELID